MELREREGDGGNMSRKSEKEVGGRNGRPVLLIRRRETNISEKLLQEGPIS